MINWIGYMVIDKNKIIYTSILKYVGLILIY